MITFDEILELNVKMGPAQYKNIAVVMIIDFMEGFMYVFFTLLLGVLQEQWNLSSAQLSNLASVYFFGIMSGNLTCALIVDQVGRKNVLVFTTGLQVLVIFNTASSQTYLELIIIMWLFGYIYGITLPLGYIVVNEIVLAEYRGRVTLLVACGFILGKIYLIGASLFFLDNFRSGNWRGLVMLGSGPAIMSFMGCLLFMKESPRFILSQSNYIQAFWNIDEMGYDNNKDYRPLNEDEKDMLIQWNQALHNFHIEDKSQMELLFDSTKLIKITVFLCLLFLCYNFQMVTVYFLSPILLENAEKGIETLLIVYFYQLAGMIILFFVIDNINIGGRNRWLSICSLLLTLLNIIIFFGKKSLLTISLILFKVVQRMIITNLEALASESYLTHYRAGGIGLALGVGAVGAILTLQVIFFLNDMYPYLPFLLVALTSLFSFFIVRNYPVDMNCKHLDNLHSKQDLQQ